MSEQAVVTHEAKMQSLKSLTQAVYILYALSYFTGITALVGIIINYVKQDEAAGTWLESHFRWQIRTFWFGLLWAVIGAVTAFILISFAVLFANFCWIIYRIVKGWLNLNDNKAMLC
ncbi:MAG: hypothetical protein HKM01_01380 [Gallionella sp.]|nr:hypothetical protein [Gallionella sp.]